MTSAAEPEAALHAHARPPPRLVVGLGNPGAQYRGSRHNLGAEWLERLAKHLGASFAVSKRFNGLCAEAQPASGPLLLFIPDCWMNISGAPVARCLRKNGWKPEQLLVVHDEIDLPAGRGRFKFGGGDAGHNGLRDLRIHLGTGDYWRLRLGTGRPASGAQGRNHVLSRPSAQERAAIEQTGAQALQSLDALATGGWEQAMLLLHTQSG